MRRPNPGDLVAVTWADCWSKDPWTSTADLLQTYDPNILTVGVYRGRNLSGSWVVSSGCGIDDGMEDQSACTWMVPQKMIRRWKVLKFGKKGGGRVE